MESSLDRPGRLLVGPSVSGGARFIPTRSIPTSVIPTHAVPTPRPEPSIKRVWPTSPLARFAYAEM